MRSAIKPENLIHWWPLYQGGAVDIVGTADGTINGPVAAQGRIDEGLDFERDNTDYVALGDLDIHANSAWTVAGWVKVETTTGSQNIWSERSSASLNAWVILAHSGGIFYVSEREDTGNTSASASGTTSITTGKWYHVAFTKSGNTRKIFVDGIEEASDSTVISPITTNRTALGASDTTFVADTYDGVQQDFMAWNTALTADELKAQMRMADVRPTGVFV